MARRKAREVALQVLFEVDVGGSEVEFALTQAGARERLRPDVLAYAARLVRGTVAHLGEIDRALAPLTPGWPLRRMANVDRSVLRLAMYELLYEPDVPPGVAVNEAVELAKRYSTAESGKFVNGVLGAFLRQRLEAPEKA